MDKSELMKKLIVKKKQFETSSGKKISNAIKNYGKMESTLTPVNKKLVTEIRKLMSQLFIINDKDKIIAKNETNAKKLGINITKGSNVLDIYSNKKVIDRELEKRIKDKGTNAIKLTEQIKKAKEKLEKLEATKKYSQELKVILSSISTPENKIINIDNWVSGKKLSPYFKDKIKQAKNNLKSKKKTLVKAILPPPKPVVVKPTSKPMTEEEVRALIAAANVGKKPKKQIGPPPGMGVKKPIGPPPGITVKPKPKDIDITGMKKIKKKVAEPSTPKGKKPEKMLDAEYLKNVRIKYGGKTKNIKEYKDIYDRLINPKLINFSGADKIIEEVVTAEKDNLKKGSKVWIKCSKKCFTHLSKLLDKESELTAFMLKVMSECVIDTTNGKFPLVFTCGPQITNKGKGLTGKWKDDSKHFKLEPLDNTTKQRRLIMGFGPSASGKTFWASNIIKLMGLQDKEFPKSFLSIDGGKVREISYMYTHIVDEISKHEKILGFDNLVKAGLSFGRSLFESGGVKSGIKKYLKEQSERYVGCPVSLYIPETLGSCINPLKACSSKYTAYKKMTKDDKWIGLYIWQHKEKGLCDFGKGFKCISCLESGSSRELSEGKKYSNSAYSVSKKNGIIQMKKAPGGRFDIHNCGDPKWCKTNKTTIVEYPIVGKYILSAKKDIIEKKYNSVYKGAESTNKEIVKHLNIAHKAAETPEEKKAIDKMKKAYADKDKVKKPKLNMKKSRDNVKKVKSKTIDLEGIQKSGKDCNKFTAKKGKKNCGDHVYKHSDKKNYICRNPARLPGKCRPTAGMFGSRKKAPKTHARIKEATKMKGGRKRTLKKR